MEPGRTGVGMVASALDCPSDHELLAAFLDQRSEEAFAELIRRHGPMVVGVGRRIAGSEAEDVAQTVFLELARQGPAAKEIRNLPGWLRQVARNQATHRRDADQSRRRHEAAAAREAANT